MTAASAVFILAYRLYSQPESVPESPSPSCRQGQSTTQGQVPCDNLMFSTCGAYGCKGPAPTVPRSLSQHTVITRNILIRPGYYKENFLPRKRSKRLPFEVSQMSRKDELDTPNSETIVIIKSHHLFGQSETWLFKS